jgi:AraC-like DNA-binding protein
MDGSSARDDQALELRVKGKSFTAIATALGYERPLEAREAFIRALRRKPEDVRADLRHQEMGRLDAMADVFRSKQELDGDEIAQRLRAVDRLREMLMAD